MKPMLAVEAEDFEALTYPLLASYKLDGIRCLITAEGPRTRSLKPVPNKFIASKLSNLPIGLDGELVVLDKNGNVDFRSTTSAVMSHDGEPNFEYRVFDSYTANGGFLTRSKAALAQLDKLNIPWLIWVPQILIMDALGVQHQFEEAIAGGYEGLILRDQDAPYKHGRSTLKSQWMLKVKPWKDAEATIIGVVEACENTNEATTNELGRTQRSSAKAGKIPKGTLGCLVVTSPKWSQPFEIGTGFDDKEKLALWKDKKLIGKLVRFSYVDAGGYDKPRHCSYQGIRDERDI